MFKEPLFEAVKPMELSQNERILAGFTAEQKTIIENKRKVLSSLAFFIGKDFNIPVDLNERGAGWHWDFKNNIIRIDPNDLLEKDEEYLKFVISHEGGHRRVSRTDFIPLETWQEPGFSFMMNAIEDPRTNNFVSEAYPKFREQMPFGYEWIEELEKNIDEKITQRLGYQPRFKQAGFAYIKQWFREVQNQEQTAAVGLDLPDDVRAVVEQTLSAVRDSYLTYPSREEADKGGILPNGKKANNEEMISAFAQASYRINLNKVWPEFKKLVEKDQEDQKMQELMKDLEKEKAESQKQSGDNQSLPSELKDKLSEEEQRELEKAIETAMQKSQDEKGEKPDGAADKSGAGSPIDMDSLSEELKQKIKDYLNSLPDDKKRELSARAEKALKEFEKEMSEELEGRLTQNPVAVDKALGEEREKEADGDDKIKDEESAVDLDAEDLAKDAAMADKTKIARQFREQVEKSLASDQSKYDKYRQEVLEVIEKLENELRDIFVARRAQNWQTGHRSGKRVDIEKRMQEEAKGVPVIESQAWKRREMPLEKDYAISLLVDLSGSMDNDKISEAFKSAIVLGEVLSRLAVRLEILGFNDRIYEYKNFDEPMSNKLRANMGGMLQEVKNRQGGRANYNDDGWALGQASVRLAEEQGQEKFLIVLSDGSPEPSDTHRGAEFDLKKTVENIAKNTEQKVIGLGILTDSVQKYYKQNLPNISAQDLSKKLAQVIKDCIENKN